MQENKELYFGYFKHISQNIIFNDYVNLLPLNSYPETYLLFCFSTPEVNSSPPLLRTRIMLLCRLCKSIVIAM